MNNLSMQGLSVPSALLNQNTQSHQSLPCLNTKLKTVPTANIGAQLSQCQAALHSLQSSIISRLLKEKHVVSEQGVANPLWCINHGGNSKAEPFLDCANPFPGVPFSSFQPASILPRLSSGTFVTSAPAVASAHLYNTQQNISKVELIDSAKKPSPISAFSSLQQAAILSHFLSERRVVSEPAVASAHLFKPQQNSSLAELLQCENPFPISAFSSNQSQTTQSWSISSPEDFNLSSGESSAQTTSSGDSGEETSSEGQFKQKKRKEGLRTPEFDASKGLQIYRQNLSTASSSQQLCQSQAAPNSSHPSFLSIPSEKHVVSVPRVANAHLRNNKKQNNSSAKFPDCANPFPISSSSPCQSQTTQSWSNSSPDNSSHGCSTSRASPDNSHGSSRESSASATCNKRNISNTEFLDGANPFPISSSSSSCHSQATPSCSSASPKNSHACSSRESSDGTTCGDGEATCSSPVPVKSTTLLDRRKKFNSTDTAGKKRMLTLDVSTVSKLFHLPIQKAADQIGICVTSMKRVCRRFGIKEWPYIKPSKSRNELLS